MPQKFLDYPQIRPAFEHGGCCGVAEPVWGHVPHCELRVAADGLVNYSADLPLVEPTPAHPNEQRRITRRGKLTAVGKPVCESLIDDSAVGNHAGLISLTGDTQEPVGPVEILDVNGLGLANTNAGAKQQLGDEPIPHPARCGASPLLLACWLRGCWSVVDVVVGGRGFEGITLEPIEEGAGLVTAHHAWQCLLSLGQPERRDRVRGEHLALGEKLPEAFHAGGQTGEPGPAGAIVGGVPQHVACVVEGEGLNIPQPLESVGEVPLVGPDRVFRPAEVIAQVVHVVLEEELRVAGFRHAAQHSCCRAMELSPQINSLPATLAHPPGPNAPLPW